MPKPYATVQDARTSLQNKTGTWRTMRPEYVHRMPPCNLMCPAGENIQLWLAHAQEGKLREAWEVMVDANPFPAIMGRVCYHTCELACNRTHFDGAVNINRLERSIGDVALNKRWSFPVPTRSTGKKVLVIGGGPSGLSAAYFLRRFGHSVTIYEANHKLGGAMRYGIPRYRLSTAVLDAEIDRLLALGIEVECDKRVSDVAQELQNFDAVYLAMGASLAVQINIPTDEGATVIDAIEMFRCLENDKDKMPALGKTVIVYGGGNSAIDAARTARRLGADKVQIVYRRAMEHMRAHDSEIKEALAEGVEILCLRTIGHIHKGSVSINKMELQNNELVNTGQVETLQADSVIYAIGQQPDEKVVLSISDILIGEGSTIIVDKNMMTGAKGIFAGGDIVPGKRTVTDAIGMGKKAARCIDAFLNGKEIPAKPSPDIATFKKLQLDYYPKSPRIDVEPKVNLTFEEANLSYDDPKVILEARRCFSCGNCYHCNNCYAYCPDNAIIQHEDGSLEFNYEYCKGCGLCAVECPCGAIKMVPDDQQ